MKNLNKVREASKINQRFGLWTRLYYSIEEDAVYTIPGGDRIFLTELIRENTEAEIEDTVKQFMRF